MKTSVFLDKTKVVEFEILYNLGVHSLRDKFSNDQLYPKYFLTFFYYIFGAGWGLGPPQSIN
mgnify:CR=1 FL=1